METGAAQRQPKAQDMIEAALSSRFFQIV